MKLSAKDLKAIQWYMDNYQLKPLLSTPPTMYFRDKDGEQITKDLSGITLEYNAWHEQDMKERAREKRVKDTRRLIKSGIPRAGL